MMVLALQAIGLVLIVEGLAWALAPSLVERLLQQMRALPESARRQLGLLGLAIGLILVWTARQLGG